MEESPAVESVEIPAAASEVQAAAPETAVVPETAAAREMVAAPERADDLEASRAALSEADPAVFLAAP
jgi:hypothetical protein